MADQEDRPGSGKSGSQGSKVGEVVSQVTVKALQEMDTGHLTPEQREEAEAKTSRPPSGQRSARGSRPTSAAGKPSSRPGSAAGSKASPKGSAKGSRPPSVQQAEPLMVSGSRPVSARDQPGEQAEERPTSGRPASGRPGSGRPGSGRPESGRPASRERPGSGRPESGRPASSQRPASGDRPLSKASDRPGSQAERPGSQAERPGSQAERPGSVRAGSRADRPMSGGQASQASRPGSGRPASQAERPASGRPGSGRPSSGRPGSDRPASRHSPEQDVAGSWASGQEDQDGRQPPEEAPPAGPPQTREDPMEPPQMTTDMMLRDPMDPDGGDDGDSEEEDEEEEMGEGELAEDTDDSDGEGEMVVLDPDHPLMRRFQKSLKSHLEKQNEKVTLELRELQEAVKNKRETREDVGVELYGVQQELARHQMMLEKYHDDFSNIRQARHLTEQELLDVREMYKSNQKSVNEEKRKGAELQGEVENLALRLHFMDSAKEDVRSDIAVMRRAAEKAESEAGKAEIDKQKQDLFVDRLVDRVDKLREEIAMYEAQLSAQGEETKSAKDALLEAHMEIEAITLEKKQLFQQWNSSLIGMRRRDEAHSAMSEALSQQQQRILSLETEIEGYKRSIGKEQEQNEKLCLILNKTETDIATVKKLLQQCHTKHEALKNEYATYTRMLHETEQALNRASTDKTLRLNEVNALRKQIEREYLEKVKLEDEILEKMRTQLTMDKAAQYTVKLTGKLRNNTKDLETQVATVENEISKCTLEVSHTRTRIERLHKMMGELDEEIQQKNDIISRSESEIVKRNAIIERKQGVIDQFNKKLEQMIAQAGGVELGPLEIQINSLQKSIEAEQQEIVELQQMWLRDQSELVSLAKTKDGESVDVENLKKQLTILSQKKLRIESEINEQTGETSDIERNIRHMQNDMLKLNMQLHNERGVEHELQQGSSLMENDFIGGLKEAEMESITMQSSLDSLKEEKERLLNSLVEAERQIMLWEKKTQLARETRAAVDSEIGAGEIKAMKAEIHRMQVRFTQLMKQQECMIQEMEKSVSRRDTIVTRGDAQSKMNKKVLTKGTFQRQMGELKKKIKTTIQDATGSDMEIKELREHQQDLSVQLEDRQLNVQQLQGNADSLDGDLERLVEQKVKNMSDLLMKQQRGKYFQQLKDGRYVRLCKTDTALENEHEKQEDRLQTMHAIMDRLNQEYPHVQPAMKKVGLVYGSRGHTDV